MNLCVESERTLLIFVYEGDTNAKKEDVQERVLGTGERALCIYIHLRWWQKNCDADLEIIRCNRHNHIL